MNPFPSAAAFIHWLHEQQLPYLLVTNNSSRTPEQVAEHLQELGIEVPAAAVYTSSQAAAQYLTEQRGGNRVHMIGEAGLRIALEAPASHVDGTTPDYVVQGIDRSFSYEKLTEAVRHLKHGATYVLTNPDRHAAVGWWAYARGWLPGRCDHRRLRRGAGGDRQAFADHHGLRH